MNNEMNKTLIFVGVALAVCVMALVTRPVIRDFDKPSEMVGQTLTSELKDPASLQIVRYSEAEGKVKDFSVAVKNDVWSLPSHSDYPADAKKQLGDAAAALSGLKILHVASENPSDHVTYGVVDPGTPDRPGGEGSGIRVVLKSKDGAPLAALVIGKEMEKSKGIRYVRNIDQDYVCEVALSAEKLSSDFGDWIEKDLLKMDTMQIKDVQIHDYSVDAIQREVIRRSRMRLEYNDSGTPAWKMVEDQAVGKDGKWAPLAMAADEEVKVSRLDDMRFAFGGLQIVNVARKPKGLSQVLRGTKESVDTSDQLSLQNRGYYLTSKGDLMSSEGEIVVTMKDGVRYSMRFGGIAGRAESKDAKSKDDKSKESKAKDDKHDHGKDSSKEKSPAAETTRYLFVMCEFDRDAIPKPKEEPLPPEPKADPKPDPKTTPGKDLAKADAGKTPAKDEAKPDPKAERERIAAENKKNRDDYEAKIKAAEKKVKDLNDRFADWYYEIKDSEYQKIHFGRKDIVQKKEKKEGDTPGGLPGMPPGLQPGAGIELPKDSPADLAEPLKGGATSPTAKPAAPAPAPPKTEPAKTEPPTAKAPATPTPTPPAKTPAAAEKTPAAKPADPTKPAAKTAEPAKK